MPLLITPGQRAGRCRAHQLRRVGLEDGGRRRPSLLRLRPRPRRDVRGPEAVATRPVERARSGGGAAGGRADGGEALVSLAPRIKAALQRAAAEYEPVVGGPVEVAWVDRIKSSDNRSRKAAVRNGGDQ